LASDDRLLAALRYLAILLFVSAGVLPLARGRHSWVKWARRGSIVIFVIAFAYATALAVLWALARSF
jgi:hypothetical protein